MLQLLALLCFRIGIFAIEGPGIWWRTKDIYFCVLVGRKLEKQRDE